MRMRVWWSLVLVAAVLVTTAVPSSARTSLPSHATQIAAGCRAPKATRELNLEAADRLNDMSGMTTSGAAVIGAMATKAAVQQSLATAAGETAAAAMAGESVLILGSVTAGLGLVAAALWAGYYYYKETNSDPPDPHFRAIASPLVRTVALEPVPGLTAAEVNALNALAANTQQLIAVTTALATTQNRASGAAAAGQADWVQRQSDVAKQYALRLAGLLDAQPALRVRLYQLLTADDRLPATLHPSAVEVRAFQSDVAAHGLPGQLAHILQEAGIGAGYLPEFRASIASVHPAAAAGFSYPGVLTDLQITAFDRRGAASWRQFAAGVCRLQPRPSPPTPTTPTSSSAGDLVQDGPITMGPVSPNTCCKWDTGGGGSLSGTVTEDTPWGKATYTWTLPSRIPRTGAPATLTLTVDPPQSGGSANLEVELWVRGEVDIACKSGTGCDHIRAYGTGEKTDSATSTFTLKARDYTAGRKEPILIQIGCAWGGPLVTIPYRIIQ